MNVAEQILPDYLRPDLDLVVVGINPGLKSAARRHHYAGPGNHFWPLLYESGLISKPLTYAEDARILDYGIGLTNMVDRASASITDLSLAELREGAVSLRRKLEAYAPRIICFNGKAIGEVFVGRRIEFGLQPETVAASQIFIIPSTSARAAAYQRAAKLRYFEELRALVRRHAAVVTP